MTQIQQLMNEYFLASIAKDFSLCAEIESKILFNYGTMRKALHDIAYAPSNALDKAIDALMDCGEMDK